MVVKPPPVPTPTAEISFAETPADLEAAFRLRYEVYCLETHSLDPADYPNGEEKDRFDPLARHIIAKVSGAVIATMRLIPDSSLGFLMEETFVLPRWIDRARTMEHSREITRPDYRKLGIAALLEAFACAWQKEHGYLTCIGAADLDRMLPILLKRGWGVIGAPRTYHNLKAIPVARILCGNALSYNKMIRIP